MRSSFRSHCLRLQSETRHADGTALTAKIGGSLHIHIPRKRFGREICSARSRTVAAPLGGNTAVRTRRPSGGTSQERFMTMWSFEREILGERNSSGLAHARQKGKRLGRPATAAAHASSANSIALGSPKRRSLAGLTIGRIMSAESWVIPLRNGPVPSVLYAASPKAHGAPQQKPISCLHLRCAGGAGSAGAVESGVSVAVVAWEPWCGTAPRRSLWRRAER